MSKGTRTKSRKVVAATPPGSRVTPGVCVLPAELAAEVGRLLRQMLVEDMRAYPTRPSSQDDELSDSYDDPRPTPSAFPCA